MCLHGGSFLDGVDAGALATDDARDGTRWNGDLLVAPLNLHPALLPLAAATAAADFLGAGRIAQLDARLQ